MRVIKIESKALGTIYDAFHPIYSYFYDNFLNNAFIIEQFKAANEEANLLQDAEKIWR
jgi:hypothetical protein